MEQAKMNQKTIYIRSIIIAFLMLSVFSASAQYSLTFQVTNACNGANSGAITVIVTDPIVPADTYTFDWTGPNGYVNSTMLTSIGALEGGSYNVV
ncbi:MAG: hypothetical protein RIC80_22635, partial [Cyclobacteriaceae bacterium]